MGHDQELVHAKTQADVDLDAQRDHEALAKDWEWVKAYADGKHSQKDLGQHIAGLASWTGEAIKLMPKIAKRTDGELVLECAARLGMPLVDSIKLGRQAKKPAGAGAIREHLRQQSLDRLAELDGDAALVADLHAHVLKGPLSIELPIVVDLPTALLDKKNIIKWFVESVDPLVMALAVSSVYATDKLAATLDALADQGVARAWGWLSAVHSPNLSAFGPKLLELEEKSKNDAAKAQLRALTKDYEKDDTKREKQRAAAQTEVAKQLGGKDDAALLGALGTSDGAIPDADRKKVPGRLNGAPAETVLEFLFSQVVMSPENVKDGIELFHSAKGVNGQHLRSFFLMTASENVATALQDDKVRKYVRGIIGRSTSIHSLFPSDRDEAVHLVVVKDEALRQWAYEDGSPRTLLWLAAGSAAGAKKGCQIVKSEKTNDWVKQLPPDANKEDMRRFVLNSSDASAVSYMKSTWLHDGKHAVPEEENQKRETDGAVYGGKIGDGTPVAEVRVTALSNDDPKAGNETDPSILLARLADLNATERADLLRHPGEIRSLLAHVAGFEMRAVELLQPTLGQLASFPIKNKIGLVDYTSIRPASEQLDAAQSATTFHALLGDVSPFIAFPALTNANTLAKALDDNVELLEWILEDTDANRALALLSRDPARKIAAGLIGEARSVNAGLPAYEHLRKAGKQGFDAIAKDIKGDDNKSEVEDYKTGDGVVDKDADDRAKRVGHAAKTGNLPANIDDILAANGSPAELIAVVQAASPQAQIELLSGEHGTYVRRLRNHVKIGPHHVFPELTVTQLLSLPDGAKWYLDASVAPTTVLHFVEASDGATQALGKAVSKYPDYAKDWIAQLPHGAELTARERQTIDELASSVTNDAVLRSLFMARFDVKLGSNFGRGETTKVWNVLRRLPHAQIDQTVVHDITNTPLAGPIGQWGRDEATRGKPEGQIDLDIPRMDGKDAHYKREIWMTAAEVKEYYNLDDKKLKEAVEGKDAFLQFENGLYKVKLTSPEQFDATVLHEVGHSVDSLLGEHTDFIYDPKMAGWKRYGYDEFEQFAEEMGAFDKVSSKDRKQIVDVWQQSLRSKTAVSHLVAPDHPAMSQPSPLLDFVEQAHPFTHDSTNLKPHNGRVFLQTPTALASISKQGYDAAPTDYSMTAPAEYFAECYVEYYCRYNGTKDTEDKKGGRLPAWIKKWFNERVDGVRFSPNRVHKGMGDGTS